MKFAFALLYLISLLPMRVIHLLAKGVAVPAFYLAKRRRRIGEINLALCFPEKSTAERQSILKQHFYHMAAMGLEYGVCWYASAERLYRLTEYHDKHYLDEALAAGKKVIILYPHFCAFEMTGYKLNQDVPLISVYSRQKNKAMDEQIRAGRLRYNNGFLVARTDGLLSIIRTLKKHNAPFVYLPDQDFGAKDSVFVPFFGIDTATTDGVARIAKLTGAVVIPAIPKRLDNGRFELRFYPPWEDFPSQDTVADTARMNAFIEARAREIPEQYFWLHKRFKTRPAGEASFYE